MKHPAAGDDRRAEVENPRDMREGRDGANHPRGVECCMAVAGMAAASGLCMRQAGQHACAWHGVAADGQVFWYGCGHHRVYIKFWCISVCGDWRLPDSVLNALPVQCCHFMWSSMHSQNK